MGNSCQGITVPGTLRSSHQGGTHLTEQLVECWHGFYARVILTFRGAPNPALLPFGQLWAPLPHINHEPASLGARQHVVFVPGGTPLLFSYTFMAAGNEVQWFDWLPLAVQASVLLLRPVAFRLQRVHDTIRTEIPPLCLDSGCDPFTVSHCHCGQGLLPASGESRCHLQP